MRSDETGLNYVSNNLITCNCDVVIFLSHSIFQHLGFRNRLVLSSQPITAHSYILKKKEKKKGYSFYVFFITKSWPKFPLPPISPFMASPYSVMWSPWRNKMEVEPQPASKDIRPST